jgi:hypothetical protein
MVEDLLTGFVTFDWVNELEAPLQKIWQDNFGYLSL